MVACLTLTPHLPIEELEARYRAWRDVVERRRWPIIWLVGQGHRGASVARLTCVSETWVRTIIHRDNDLGPDGLADRRHANPGPPPLVSSTLQEAWRARLATPPPDGGLWTGPKVAAWLSAQAERPIRPQARAADPVAQAAFKKGGSRTPSMLSGQPIPTPWSRSGPRTSTGLG